MELKETVEMMLSDDYKERFRAEYNQLDIRCNKLRSMLKRWDSGGA
jgi:lysozyme family protein